MPPSSRTTTTSVWTRRRVVNSGISAVPLPFAESSLQHLPRRYPFASLSKRLQAAGDAVHERLRQRLAAPHHRHQRGPGEEVGDVVLAEIDEGEAERAGVGPAQRPLDLAGFRERERRRDQEVAKCSEGIAAQGLPPSALVHLRPGRPQVSSPTSTMIRRTSSPVRPSSEAHQGGAVGTAK